MEIKLFLTELQPFKLSHFGWLYFLTVLVWGGKWPRAGGHHLCLRDTSL